MERLWKPGPGQAGPLALAQGESRVCILLCEKKPRRIQRVLRQVDITLKREQHAGGARPAVRESVLLAIPRMFE